MHLEVKDTIISRMFEHIIWNSMWENLVAVSMFFSIVNSVSTCIKLLLEPGDKDKAKYEPKSEVVSDWN
jgi:hypothetical protein